MPQYDASRLADIRKLEGKLADPSTSEHERSRIDNALYAIREQSRHPSIQRMRDKMTEAIRNGDRVLAERLGEEGKRIDRNYQ